MGPQDPKDVTRDTARDLSGMAGELAALKADARHWLTSPEYAVLHLRLENAHAAVEAALIEARRRVRMTQIIPTALSADRVGQGRSGRGITRSYPGSCK
jgi:hypothetical protein